MKTAISLPDALFEQAERVAKVMEISRSQLYARALQAYLAKHDTESTTKAFDAVYENEPSEMDSVVMQLQIASLPKEEW